MPNYIGKEVVAEGKIVETYYSPKDNVHLIFDLLTPNHCLYGFIAADLLNKFPENPELYFMNRTV